jgi:hypothetical protein
MTAKRSNTPVAEFKFGDAQQGQPSSITAVDKLNAYIVSYHDGAGKQQTRIAFRIPGADSTFLLQERINGVNVATSAHEWFHKALASSLKSKGLESSKEGNKKETVESV